MDSLNPTVLGTVPSQVCAVKENIIPEFGVLPNGRISVVLIFDEDDLNTTSADAKKRRTHPKRQQEKKATKIKPEAKESAAWCDFLCRLNCVISVHPKNLLWKRLA